MSTDHSRLPTDPAPLLAGLAANEISDPQVDALYAMLAEDTPATRDLALRIRDTLLIRGWIRAEYDQRFALETANLIARLRQRTDRAFVSDTMQRVRCAARKGRQTATQMQLPNPSKRTSAHPHRDKRHTWIPAGLVAMAMVSAACVLTAVSLGLFRLPKTDPARNGPSTPVAQQSPGVEVVSATDARRGAAQSLSPGDRLCAGETIATGPAGTAQLRYADGTGLMLRSSGELLLLPGTTSAGATSPSKHLLLRTGELTATVSPQPADQPVVLLTPHATLTVVGTQFDVQALDAQTRLRVTEGTVRMQHGEEQLQVEKGTLAIADGAGLRKAGPDENRRYEDLMATLSVAETSGEGQWSVRLDKEGPVLCQTNAACASATLRLAPPKWRTGYLTGQFRFIGSTKGETGQIEWQMPVRSSSSGLVKMHPIPYLTVDAVGKEGCWFNLNVRFHISEDGRLFTECMPCWPEGVPPELGRVGALDRESTEPSAPSVPPVQNADLFGLAIQCKNAIAEFRKLRFCAEPDVPELHLERTVFEKTAAQKGSGIDVEKVTAGPKGAWHLMQTDEGLQILQNDNAAGPTVLNLGVLPHRRVYLSGQIIALPPDRTDGVPTELTDDHTRVAPNKKQLAFNRLQLVKNGGHTESPCFLAVPADVPDGHTATVMHFHSRTEKTYGIPKVETWYHFVAFLDLDVEGKQAQGHSYWPEGMTPHVVWCIPPRTTWPASSPAPFTLQLYCDGQRILWRNLKIVPY